MLWTRPTRTPHRRLATRAFRIALGLALLGGLWLGPASRAAALPPHGEHHPRLFFGAGEEAALYAAIQTDNTRSQIWQVALNVSAEVVTWEPDSLLKSYAGFQHIEGLSLLSTLDPGPAALTDARAVIDALIWQCETFDTELDGFLATLAPTLRLHNLAWGYDLAGWAATEAEREQIAAEILLYLEDMATDFEFTRFHHNPYVSNKGISLGAMMMLAVLALEPDMPGEPALALGRAAAEQYLDFGLGQMFSPEGVYREGLGYEVWAMRTLMPTLRALDRLEAHAWEPAFLQRVLEAVAYQSLELGGGRFLNRNNHNTNDYIVGRHHSLFEFATSYGPDLPFARWLLRRVSGDLGNAGGYSSDPIATLLWHTSGPEKGPEQLPPSRFFAEGGLWVYRVGWPGDPLPETFMATMEAAEFRGGHYQEDVGQFTLRAFGHGFALDNGAGNPAKETQAHNLPMVGGRGQHNAGASIGTDGKLRRAIAGPRWELLRADMTAAYTTYSPFNAPDWPLDGIDWSWGYDGGNPMRRALRELLILPGSPGELPTVFLRDRLEPEPAALQRIDWRMHMAQDLAITQSTPGRWQVAGMNGALRMQLHGAEAALVDWSEALFDNQNVDPDTRVFTAGLIASQADFLWQLTPLAPGAEGPVVVSEIHADGRRLFINEGDRERTLLVAAGARPFLVDDTLLDGDWGLIEREGTAKRTLLVDGTRLIEGGTPLIELSERASAGCEGDTVRLSCYVPVFRIWAPEAVAVLAVDSLVAFARDGDYVFGPPPPDEEEPPPDEADDLALHAWPNPSNAPVQFALASPGTGPLRLEIFDLRGRRLHVCAGASEPDLAGGLSLRWSGCDESGAAMPSGVYLARATQGGASTSTKFVLLRR
jgi:hypothetical protein